MNIGSNWFVANRRDKDYLMTEQPITDMNYVDFESLVDGYIGRSSQEFGEMPASSFFELLFERMAERATGTIELEGEIVNNQLVLRLPMEKETAVYVKGNEIVIGDQRIVVKLKDDSTQPTVH